MQAMPDFERPERRMGKHAVLTSDELMMLTDFSQTSAATSAPNVRPSLFPGGALALVGLGLGLITAMASPLNEREGLWTPQASGVIAAAEATPGWQAFKNWQTGLSLTDDIPLAIGLSTAPTLFQTPITNFALLMTTNSIRPSGATINRGETSKPELSSSSAPTTPGNTTTPSAPTARTQAPSSSTANLSNTLPAPSSGNLFSALFSGLNASLASNPAQPSPKSAIAVASNVSNSAQSPGSRAEPKSPSNSNSNANSNSEGKGNSHGGSGNGGSRRS